MKILVYSTYHFNTHAFGAILETIQKHLNNNDEVLFLSCNGELKSCQVNPFHSNLVCKTCINIRNNGLNCLEGKMKTILIKDVISPKEIDFQFSKMDTTSIDQFKQINYKSFDIGMAVFSSVVSIFRNPQPDLEEHKELVTKQWESSILVYEAINRLIEKENIDRVYVFNGRFAVLRACLRACEAKQTDCYVLEESNHKNKYTIYPNSTPHSIKHIEKLIHEYWEQGGDDKSEKSMAYYQNRSQGNDKRFGHFVSDQDINQLPNGWDPNKKNIAVFISSEDEFVSVGSEWINPIYKSQADGISQITNSMEDNDQFVFYIRVHPNLKGIINDSIKELYAIKNKNSVIIPAESPVSTYALMFNADKIISFGSSVGIEAAAFGKLSILAGKTFYMDLGSTYNPKNHEELIELVLADNLVPKPTLGALKYAYFLMNFGEEYLYFKQIDSFSGYMNNKKFGLSPLYFNIRKLGRMMRLLKEKMKKKRNIKNVSKL